MRTDRGLGGQRPVGVRSAARALQVGRCVGTSPCLCARACRVRVPHLGTALPELRRAQVVSVGRAAGPLAPMPASVAFPVARLWNNQTFHTICFLKMALTPPVVHTDGRSELCFGGEVTPRRAVERGAGVCESRSAGRRQPCEGQRLCPRLFLDLRALWVPRGWVRSAARTRRRAAPVTWQGDAGSFLRENARLQNLTSLLSGFLVFCRNSFLSGRRC